MRSHLIRGCSPARPDRFDGGPGPPPILATTPRFGERGRTSERERDLGTSIDLALGPDTSAVPLDDPLHDREADPRALELAGAVETGEVVEDPAVAVRERNSSLSTRRSRATAPVRSARTCRRVLPSAFRADATLSRLTTQPSVPPFRGSIAACSRPICMDRTNGIPPRCWRPMARSGAPSSYGGSATTASGAFARSAAKTSASVPNAVTSRSPASADEARPARSRQAGSRSQYSGSGISIQPRSGVGQIVYLPIHASDRMASPSGADRLESFITLR